MSNQRIPLTDHEENCESDCLENPLDRRKFLFASGASLVSVFLPGAGSISMPAQKVDYPRVNIADVTQIQVGQSVPFSYPWDHPNCRNLLIRLRQSAPGGIGPHQSIVAFNLLCTHMGRRIRREKFDAQTGVAGPCSWHWTTFDLTRHGMVISGHATQGLPQILLELDGNNIVATGVMGLLYGFHNNQINPNNEE